MERIIISGGSRLNGTVRISGSKNAALPLMAASLLTEDLLILENFPRLGDTDTLVKLLSHLGVEIGFDGPSEDNTFESVISLRAAGITDTAAPYDIVRKMRASILVLGPLLARCGRVTVSLPGGCAIGTRPVDLHLAALESLGAQLALRKGYIHARAPKGLTGTNIRFSSVSVGATENLLMAASLAKGTTILENAAREPEITDLAQCLCAMGANISGIGTSRLVVEGVNSLHGARYRILPDRIETGTYAIAAAITGGDVKLLNADKSTLHSQTESLSQVGVNFKTVDNGLNVSCDLSGLKSISITTQPYPGFPTDMQAQIMALLSTARGTSAISEAIFENRFMHVPELCRMGADITIRGTTAIINGIPRLKGAPVMATDLRASVSLVLAGLAAEGQTVVNRVYHLDRGYECLVEKLFALGADIRRDDV